MKKKNLTKTDKSLQEKFQDCVKKPLPIHNFNDEVIIEPPKKVEVVVEPRIKELKPKPRPARKTQQKVAPPKEEQFVELAPEPKIDSVSVNNHKPEVYRLGEVYTGRRIKMAHLGLDIGTKTVVLAFRKPEGGISYISEINGYWPFERATPFVENLLNDPNKVRSDNTKRPARWIKMPETDQIIVLGRDAEEFAYAKNDTLRRPMAEGGVAAEEESMTVLASIVQGLIETAEKDVGEFGDEVKVTYCTTAGALNSTNVNIDYHERVVSTIIANYKSNSKIMLVGPEEQSPGAIKESHAIVLEMSEDGTGIGISWGAGTVTVSYVKYGMEIYSFCWVGAGDWIDLETAKRHGYNPEAGKMQRKSKETPTTVSRRKEQLDLTPGHQQPDRLMLDLSLHYDVLIDNVIEGIVNGFVENENEARIDEAINVYMAGGTSSPVGFSSRVADKFDKADVPFEIARVKNSDNPLFCVAAGCLKAAELF